MDRDNFHNRIKPATEKEGTDATTLEQKYGCEVMQFGQGLLPPKLREYLRKYPILLPLRWLPDLVVIRPDLQPARQVNLHVDSSEGMRRAKQRNYASPSGLTPNVTEYMWLIDSKYSPPEKHRYVDWILEKSAHEAHRLQQPALGLPIVYIWPDGYSCSYVEDLPDEVLIDGSWNGSGSGTPFWRVPKKLTKSLDEVFGKGVVL